MLVSIAPQMTWEEFVAYDDGTGSRYEWVNGALVEMGAESDANNLIGMLLISVFLQFVPYYRLRRGTEIAICGNAGNILTSRIPDLMVLTEAGALAMPSQQRSRITADMPAPALVVEVVSPGEPGESNYDRDYVEKRQEYAARGIPEYWIIDPKRQVVIVLTLVGQSYHEQVFSGAAKFSTLLFANLEITAEQILQAGA